MPRTSSQTCRGGGARAAQVDHANSGSTKVLRRSSLRASADRFVIGMMADDAAGGKFEGPNPYFGQLYCQLPKVTGLALHFIWPSESGMLLVLKK